MQKSLEDHYNAALWIVRYLKVCLGQGILLPACACSNLSVTAYCDADSGACAITCRSCSAYIVMRGLY